ncbi:DNA repair protein RAD51 homolog 3 isoform X2 [Achroia grisella]|uniref:DNA repair protein RAD51 homolog 3 isoform X2 n=1 Tax=Achroia grisella TaxID=688607 RepID=UPI0027D277C7|nr:DNA repair protein RAD51 homolog 3 isoform X2 [Achroia grisella]
MNSSFKIYNCVELWHRETSLPSIPTFSQSLDKILGHDGVQLCTVTELLGLPGSGKTQICIQLCASVQIPNSLGGLEAEALYIDTNTHFTPCRFKDIVVASLLKCQSVLSFPTVINEEDALKKLHYVNAFGIEKFCAFIYGLRRFVEEHSNIRLIVIDSIAFPFKEGISPGQRTGLLFRLMADLQRLAMEKQIAVVLTNEMSTRVGLSTGSVVGSLGDAWAHRCNKRVLLSVASHSSERLALSLKSNTAYNNVARFKITQEGIRDVE